MLAVPEVALCVSRSSLMSSDRMKPRSGDWAVTIDFLQEAAITSLSSGSSVKCELCSSFHSNELVMSLISECEGERGLLGALLAEKLDHTYVVRIVADLVMAAGDTRDAGDRGAGERMPRAGLRTQVTSCLAQTGGVASGWVDVGTPVTTLPSRPSSSPYG
uniref:Uncharacterized protein n=1 Tax=Timema monikensis TaxID=170555 RepID=A0A7R9EJW0_9NEOP|nr:unnamed protein product [Timema monikensis]